MKSSEAFDLETSYKRLVDFMVVRSKSKNTQEAASMLAALIGEHLDAMPLSEQKQRIRAFKKTVAKTSGSRAKSPAPYDTSRNQASHQNQP